MKWLKHDSDAHRDAKLKKLILRHGIEGYGLYWYCIELIASDVDQHNITFELEHDAEIIAHDTRLSVDQVNQMMACMIDLGLFENTGGVVTCLKLAKRLDQSMTSNPEMRKVIEGIKNNHDSIMTKSEIVMQDKTRLDKNRINNKPSPKVSGVPYQKIVELYHDKLPTLPKVEKLTATRKAQIRQRWLQDLTELDHWENFFEYVSKSKFLMGNTPPANGHKPFRANLEWLTKESNFTKVSEENYHG